jgi:hypothetical protein
MQKEKKGWYNTQPIHQSKRDEVTLKGKSTVTDSFTIDDNYRRFEQIVKYAELACRLTIAIFKIYRIMSSIIYGNQFRKFAGEVEKINQLSVVEQPGASDVKKDIGYFIINKPLKQAEQETKVLPAAKETEPEPEPAPERTEVSTYKPVVILDEKDPKQWDLIGAVNKEMEGSSLLHKQPVTYESLEKLLERAEQFTETVYRAIVITAKFSEYNLTDFVLVTANLGNEIICWTIMIGHYPFQEDIEAQPNLAHIRDDVKEASNWVLNAITDLIDDYTGKSVIKGSMYPVSLQVYTTPGSTKLLDIENRKWSRKAHSQG